MSLLLSYLNRQQKVISTASNKAAISNDLMLAAFIDGLPKTIKKDVSIQQPKSLEQALKLARIAEEAEGDGEFNDVNPIAKKEKKKKEGVVSMVSDNYRKGSGGGSNYRGRGNYRGGGRGGQGRGGMSRGY